MRVFAIADPVPGVRRYDRFAVRLRVEEELVQPVEDRAVLVELLQNWRPEAAEG